MINAGKVRPWIKYKSMIVKFRCSGKKKCSKKFGIRFESQLLKNTIREECIIIIIIIITTKAKPNTN